MQLISIDKPQVLVVRKFCWCQPQLLPLLLTWRWFPLRSEKLSVAEVVQQPSCCNDSFSLGIKIGQSILRGNQHSRTGGVDIDVAIQSKLKPLRISDQDWKNCQIEVPSTREMFVEQARKMRFLSLATCTSRNVLDVPSMFLTPFSKEKEANNFKYIDGFKDISNWNSISCNMDKVYTSSIAIYEEGNGVIMMMISGSKATC